MEMVLTYAADDADEFLAEKKKKKERFLLTRLDLREIAFADADE